MSIVTDVILPLALAFIMFSLGLGLTAADFLRVAKQPRDFALGLFSQVIVLPLIAFGLAVLWSAPPEIALGLMLIAAAPGGVTSNILTRFGRGDVALSISLTAIVSLLSVITIPVIAVFSYTYFVGESTEARDVSIVQIAVSVFLIVTVPVLLGMAVRHFLKEKAARFEPIANAISTGLFILVLMGAVAAGRESIEVYFAEAGLITLVLNVVMMGVAFGLAAKFASGPRQQVAIAIECGLQNGTLAITVGIALFGGGLAIIPAATYSLIMFATALIFVFICRRVFPN